MADFIDGFQPLGETGGPTLGRTDHMLTLAQASFDDASTRAFWSKDPADIARREQAYETLDSFRSKVFGRAETRSEASHATEYDVDQAFG